MKPCFHCGLSCAGRRSLLLGELRDFCCAGCEAVARTIVDGGFESYYRTRTELASTPQARAPLEKLPNSGSASLILEGLRCSACAWLIEQVLRQHAGVTRMQVNYATQRTQVDWDATQASLAEL